MVRPVFIILSFRTHLVLIIFLNKRQNFFGKHRDSIIFEFGVKRVGGKFLDVFLMGGINSVGEIFKTQRLKRAGQF